MLRAGIKMIVNNKLNKLSLKDNILFCFSLARREYNQEELIIKLATMVLKTPLIGCLIAIKMVSIPDSFKAK